MNSAPGPAPAPPKRDFGTWLRDMPRWKQVAVGSALGAVILGSLLGAFAGADPVAAGPTGGGNGAAGLSASLAEGGQPAGAEPVEEPPAKGLFRLGFSFLAGFCIGSFVRATLLFAAIAFGFWLLATMALAYYGVLTVDWNAIELLWQRFAGNVEQEWGSFQRFATGSLPSAGLALAGLAVGLERH